MKILLSLILLFLGAAGLAGAEVVDRTHQKFSQNTRVTEWEFQANKTINDIVYNEQGEIITVVVSAGAFITYLKTTTSIYKCSDINLEGDKFFETLCYKLARPR